MTTEYGDKFETPLIILISLFTVGALVAVITLVATHTPDCRSAELTYCGHESGF